MGNNVTGPGVSEAGAAAGGPAENNITDEMIAAASEEERVELLRRRRMMSSAVDDADASHQGGMGAQGGQVDFGNPKNYGLPGT